MIDAAHAELEKEEQLLMLKKQLFASENRTAWDK